MYSCAPFREWNGACLIVGPDWIHWKVQGDWHFDPEYWPDPSAMVKEINGLGMEVKPFQRNNSDSSPLFPLHACRAID
jgi:alpha-glucosidase (family GH31 glycosyl hydrolase)